jgi:hypothetical protein
MGEEAEERDHARGNNKWLGNGSVADGVFVAGGAVLDQINAGNCAEPFHSIFEVGQF